MATIVTLSGDNGPLTDLDVPLGRRETKRRWFYAGQEFMGWLRQDVPQLETGRLRAADTPQEQLDQILYKWISGGEITYQRMFKDLMPMSDEVWEMKTADIRIFGWMCEPLKFIAVFGDYADNYKLRGRESAYDLAKRRVIRFRDCLDLEEPKIASGTFDALISV